MLRGAIYAHRTTAARTFMNIFKTDTNSNITSIIKDLLNSKSDKQETAGLCGGSRQGKAANFERDSQRLNAALNQSIGKVNCI